MTDPVYWAGLGVRIGMYRVTVPGAHPLPHPL